MSGKGSRYHAAIPSAVWARLRRHVYNRDEGICGLCGLPVIVWEVHHRVHLEDGGHPTDPANLVLVCGPCHREHHRKPDPERVEWRRYLDSL